MLLWVREIKLLALLCLGALFKGVSRANGVRRGRSACWSDGHVNQNAFYKFWFFLLCVLCCCCCCCCCFCCCCGNTKNYLHKYPRCQLCVVACKVTEAHKMAAPPLPLPLLLSLSLPASTSPPWTWLHIFFSSAFLRVCKVGVAIKCKCAIVCAHVCVCVWESVCACLRVWAVHGGQTSTVMAAKVFNFPLNCFQLSKESSLDPHTHTHAERNKHAHTHTVQKPRCVGCYVRSIKLHTKAACP